MTFICKIFLLILLHNEVVHRRDTDVPGGKGLMPPVFHRQENLLSGTQVPYRAFEGELE
jgi:hypothetical protein